MEDFTMGKMLDVRLSDAFRRLQEAEKIARSIFYNSPLHVPGPLQVPGYAEEMITGVTLLPAGDAEAKERVDVRNQRHAALLERLDGDDAPEVHAVIDESVLRRARPGSEVMRTQIEHLIEVSRKPSVQIGVIPLAHGPHPGLIGSFEVHAGTDGALVFFEGAHGDELADDADQVTFYRARVDSLIQIAKSGDDARKLLSGIING
jgi:hypothetical protein